MTTEHATTNEQLPEPAPYRFPTLPFVAAAVLGASILVAVRPSDGYVKQIVVTKRAPMPDLNDTPDLYLQIETADASFRTETYNNKRVGNGLAWVIPTPVRATEIRVIELWDADFIRSDQLDRVSIVERQEQGELYNFRIITGESSFQLLAIIAAVASGIYCFVFITKFVCNQTI